MPKLPRTLKGLNKLITETDEEFEEHKKQIKDSGKRYTARDKKSVHFKNRLTEYKNALKELRAKNDLKKVSRKNKKIIQKKLIDMSMETPAEAPAEE